MFDDPLEKDALQRAFANTSAMVSDGGSGTWKLWRDQGVDLGFQGLRAGALRLRHKLTNPRQTPNIL